MTLDGLKFWHGARPFKPFVLRLTDERSVPVWHPEFLSHSPSGRWLTVYAPDESAESLDILHVVSINAANGTRKRRGGNGKPPKE